MSWEAPSGMACPAIKWKCWAMTASIDVVVVSPKFTGKNKVQQHQMVYLALGDRMHAESHALSLYTFTPDAWAQLAQIN